MERGHHSKFEQIMVLVGLVSPIATIPQVIKVFATHRQHAAGQSLTTWSIYTAISILWVIYGLRKGETPLRTVLNLIRSRLTGVAYSTESRGRERNEREPPQGRNLRGGL